MEHHITKSLISFLVAVGILFCGCTPATSGSSPQVTTPPPGSNAPSTVVTTGGETTPSETSRLPEDVVPSLMSASDGDELVLAIDAGMPAPFTGIILNAEAAAWLEAEPDAVHERCQLFLDRRLGEVRVSLLAENERLTLRIVSLEASHAVDIRARQDQIDSLMRVNEELRGSEGARTLETVLWAGGGVLVGVGIGVLIGLFAN